ncbi:MAG: zinc-binding dehydrogenase, partial [Planctomycetota bacterium]
DVVEAIRDLTDGGAHVSLDALGSPETCFNSISCLRPRGRHVQVGLMLGGHNHSPVPMDRIIAKELEVIGSHGMQAHAYPDMLGMIEQGKLAPAKLIRNRITLEESIPSLMDMNSFNGIGITVIDRMK